jgi:hypothetical protein
MTGWILNAKVYKTETKITNLETECKKKEQKTLFVSLWKKEFSVDWHAP